jgi:hypothetical protein
MSGREPSTNPADIIDDTIDEFVDFLDTFLPPSSGEDSEDDD